MAYQTYHCSAAFRCSVCLIAFLHTSLALSVLPLFMFYAPCPFTAQFFFCAIQLLHSPPSSHMNHLHQQQPQQPPTPTTTTPFSSLYCVFIASVHLVHAMFTMPLHADSAPLSSTSRVFCLIIIMTLQLLWQLRLFVFFVTVELTFSVLVTGFHAHPSVNPF
jgi:hypothetical protein